MFLDKLKEVLDIAKKKEILPKVYTIKGPSTNPEIEVFFGNETKKSLMFSSNNYLGIANDERVKGAVIRGIEKYGMGSGGSRLVSGNIDIQEELERQIAEFKGYEAAITFSTGYMANTGGIPAILNPPVLSFIDILNEKIFKLNTPVVFSDEFNHASIVDACRMSKSKRIIYKHKDLKDLAHKLKSVGRRKRKLIVTDGVFSMDGDIAPLEGIMDLAEKYQAAVMVDDAHATGVLGDEGRGTMEYFNLKREPEIMMGTFTKAFGAVGGFIAGSKDLINYLRVTARTYIFSAPIPPAIVAGILEALTIIKEEKRHKKLFENINYIKPKLKGLGCNILESETQIIPIIIGKEDKATKVSKKLIEEGIFVPAILWPAVPKEMSRLRVTIMSTHQREHLDTFFEKVKKVKEMYKF